MIKAKFEIVPFGVGEPFQVSGLAIANIAEPGDVRHTYIVCYSEPASRFSPGILKFRIVRGHDRNAPLLELLKTIFSGEGVWIAEVGAVEEVGKELVDQLTRRVSWKK